MIDSDVGSTGLPDSKNLVSIVSIKSYCWGIRTFEIRHQAEKDIVKLLFFVINHICVSLFGCWTHCLLAQVIVVMKPSLLLMFERPWTLPACMSDTNPWITELSHAILLKKRWPTNLYCHEKSLSKDPEKSYSPPILQSRR